MATYNQIKDWVKNKYGYAPATCYIAHVKEMSGLPTRKAWNRQNSAKRVKSCPPNKVEQIQEAFKYFRMM